MIHVGTKGPRIHLDPDPWIWVQDPDPWIWVQDQDPWIWVQDQDPYQPGITFFLFMVFILEGNSKNVSHV